MAEASVSGSSDLQGCGGAPASIPSNLLAGVHTSQDLMLTRPARPERPVNAPATNGNGLPNAGPDVEKPVNEVTELLTGGLEDPASGLPVTNEVVSGVGTAVDGTLAELEGTLGGAPSLPLP